jgi:uncharacterized protein YdaU (DUF1376 family)
VSLAYFPLYPDDFEADTAHLSLAEDGAFNRLLRLCWRTPGCSVPADRAWVYRRLRAHTEADQAIIETILTEFFREEDGRLSNARLTKEWLAANEAHTRRKSAGAKGGKAKALKTNDIAPSNATPMLKQPEPEPEPLSTTDKSVVSAQAQNPPESKSTGKVRGAARGKRIDPNWQPTPKDYAFASSHKLTREEINREADRFRNYWLAASGRNAAKLDWEATWRNWLTGEFGIVTKRAAAKPSVNGQNVGAFDRVVQRIHGALPGGEVTGHADFDTDDAGAIDGEYRIFPAGEEPGADWQRGGSGEAAFGSLFAKGGS